MPLKLSFEGNLSFYVLMDSYTVCHCLKSLIPVLILHALLQVRKNVLYLCIKKAFKKYNIFDLWSLVPVFQKSSMFPKESQFKKL